MNVWTFEAHNLGKVGSAKISSSKLVILVGRNNTGKSYVATLAWAINNINLLLRRREAQEQRPDWFKEFVVRLNSDRTSEIEIDHDRANSLLAHLNAELKLNGGDYLGEVFAYDGFKRTEIEVSSESPFQPFKAKITKPELAEPERGLPFTRIAISDLDDKNSVFIRMPTRTPEAERRIADRVFLELVRRALFGEEFRHLRRITYIPAARTGLMLAFRALVAQLFEGPSTISLPMPVKDFLRNVSLRSSLRPKENAITSWLEKEVTFGTIDYSEEEIPTFVYHPQNTDLSLPLHAASSMITELAPFFLLLRDYQSGQIIFEEPEAHLHLSAQRAMARAIAHLLNAGIRVIVTTHSDTFIQQINNLMSLHSHPNRDQLMHELHYDKNDLIDPSDVRAYEFVAQGTSTRVDELKKQDEGFIVPTLNDTLVRLAEETISLHETD